MVRCALIFAAFLTPIDCHAYIDPNAWGRLFQLLFPLLVAIGAAWMVLRQRISTLWNRLFPRRNASKDGE